MRVQPPLTKDSDATKHEPAETSVVDAELMSGQQDLTLPDCPPCFTMLTTVQGLGLRGEKCSLFMGGCQNSDPFRSRIIIGTQEGTIILTTTLMP